MADLTQFNALPCLTASGACIADGKVLLVKHKKLGIWLCPGGHLEANELPHVAAEREVFEETGLRVKAISAMPLLPSSKSEFAPIPFAVNLHWISQENYQKRIASETPDKPFVTEKWWRGCEQHYNWCYLVEPVGGIDNLDRQIEEVDEMGWFSEQECQKLELIDEIREELKLAFRLSKQLKKK
jgi:8-oxo-dGTP pyrophosphatase MutT (NUDIX family)